MNEYEAHWFSFYLMVLETRINHTDGLHIEADNGFFNELHRQVLIEYGHDFTELEGYDSADRKT